MEDTDHGKNCSSEGSRAMLYLLLAAILAAAISADDSAVPAAAAEELMLLFSEGSTSEAVALIMELEAEERLDRFDVAREIWIFGPWAGKELDDYVAMADAGIEEAMRQAKEATATEEIEALVDRANVMSYNLSADLAECWPGDTLSRAPRHFERGLSAALQCVEWRMELEKGPYPLFIAYWAAGMHQLSLGRDEQALYTLNQALNRAQQHTIDSGLPLGLAPEAGFDLILAHGYLGIALEQCGRGSRQYDLAVRAFEQAIEEYPDRAGDYAFGISQLETARAAVGED
jgi:tetratricopeptide (TPR) repeat protein